jgi:nucleoside-diphosphate-sugar epimerase
VTEPIRVAVFGATGNVGSSLVRLLGDDDRIGEIRAIARRRPDGLELPRVTWTAAKMADDDLEPLVRNADVVVHLAWAIQPSHDITDLRRTNLIGTGRLLDAIASAGVRNLIYASSIGAYSAAPRDRPVDETWPTRGVPASFYSRHKATVERMLDRYQNEHAEIRVVRMRPALTFKSSAGAEIRRLFMGPLFPGFVARRGIAPFVPNVEGLAFQCVHADDVADAYRLAILREVRGSFNVAAEPVLTMEDVAEELGTRTVRVPEQLLRTAAAVTWRLHLQPTSPGWVDLALAAPLMSTDRARTELGWMPRRSAHDALAELMEGLRTAGGERTPPLDPRAGGPLRVGEFRSGVGSRSGVNSSAA